MHFPRTGHAGFTHGAALHARHAARNPYHQTRSDDSAPLIALGDEGFEHLLSGIKVSDDAITQRAHSADVSWGAAQHQLGFITHCQGAAPLEIKSHNRGLLKNDSATGDVDQGVGCAEVDANVTGQLKTTKQHRPRPSNRRIIRANFGLACYVRQTGWNSLKAAI